MNCANHPDVEKAAFCRTCGKPLCANCTREVKGVIYCENCIAERLQGVHPPQTVYQGVVDQGAAGAVRAPGTGPHPPVAGILAGFFPFGVGAVYTGQYAKGLAHLVAFVLLIVGMGADSPWDTISAFGFAFFYVYQIIDAVRTAKAIQMGQPVPDPFGLGQAFGAAPPTPPGQPAAVELERSEAKVPTAAVILIFLGVLFLLQTAGVFEFSVGRVAPILCIALGVWLFARRWGWIPSSRVYSHADRMRGLVGPVVLVTLGMLSLIEDMGGPRWHRTWPVLLLAIGVTKLLERGALTAHPTLASPPMPPGIGSDTPGSNPAAAAPPSEVKNG